MIKNPLNQILTYSFRIKDSQSKVLLGGMARAVNFVWNYCNETSYNAITNYGDWMSKYDFNAGKASIGIDLGQRTFASDSNGRKHDTGRWYRHYERKLANAQGAKKKRNVKTIHAKTKNKRKDALHKLSDRLVRENGLIVIGDVGGVKLCKTKMAKSVFDAGWSTFRTMLEYKAIRRHGVYVVVSEHNTTRTCSVCEEIPDSAPRGVKGLGIREWVCSLCHSKHDRDVNAALNILRLGHQALGSEGSQESPTRKSKVA